MFNFKQIFLGLLVIWSLAACDKEQEQVIKNERVDVEQKSELQDSTHQENVPSYEAPKYHIYGGWMNGGSYILIKSGDDDNEAKDKFILEKFTKTGKDKIIKHFQLSKTTGSKLTGIISSKETNRTSFLTLELNKEKTEITVTLPNEKSVTYKQAEIKPEEFNSDYEWEE
ncbi:hypothetical protein MPH61_23835 [Peribacillus muralis]|uniref:hypothetical protein n=1 Tax=Peribacillus muralis TaxID=264697 RepID=UPI001F4D5EA5|nr:hypothetical protein [Peribacillus muralis]MCK1995572.1 hypothetical protein [Peribacillus muralis]MCK2016126.1 hypothetical protein [Peribacillus muralis]